MKDKKASLVVDGNKYLYTVRSNVKDMELDYKITVYSFSMKVPYFITYVDYVEAWEFDVFRPKMVELLIKFYNQNNHMLTKNEFGVKENPALLSMLHEML